MTSKKEETTGGEHSEEQGMNKEKRKYTIKGKSQIAEIGIESRGEFRPLERTQRSSGRGIRKIMWPKWW